MKGLHPKLINMLGDMDMGNRPALFSCSAKTTRHVLGRECHVHFRARRGIFVNQSSSSTVLQSLTRESILHVQNMTQRCSTLDLAKGIETYPLTFSAFAFPDGMQYNSAH